MIPSFHVPAPDTTDADGVRDWLGAESLHRVAYTTPDLHRIENEFRWMRVHSLTKFWEEAGDGSAAAAVATLLSAAARASGEVVLSVIRSDSELHYLVGVADPLGRDRAESLIDAVEGAAAACLPGSTIGRPQPSTTASLLGRAWRLPGRAALFGVPRSAKVPPELPLLQRLAESGLRQWSLTFHGEPFPPVQLSARYDEVIRLRRKYAEELATSRQVNALETKQTVDPLLVEIEELLEQEQARALKALMEGAFLSHLWINATDEAAVAAMSAIASSAAAPSEAAPFPLRPLPYGGDESPFVPLSASEISVFTAPPLHDVMGLATREWSRFDAEPEPPPGYRDGPEIPVGETAAGRRTTYPVDLLTRHACVTGMTGSGKSAFVRSLLGSLDGIPYLVIEPTKTEYADQIEGIGGLVWRVGDAATSMRLNPCEVPEGTPLSLHIDLLMGLLRSSFGLFPPLPYLLEMGLRRAYERFGWDSVSGVNAFSQVDPDYLVFPTLSDVLEDCLELVGELGYTGEIRTNVTAALRARLGSLTVGAKGAVFDTDDRFDAQEFLSQPAVVNLDLVGNDEEKAFAIGLVLIRLLEARRARRSGTLDHLTVIEEAHRVFRRTPASSAVEGAASNSFASDTLSNLLSEVRSAGEGIVVVDQSPRRLADEALANTALKVGFRTTFGEDLDRLAASMNLDDEQRLAIVGLSTFEAVVFWEGMDRPVKLKAKSSFALSQDDLGTTPEGTGPLGVASVSGLETLAYAWLASDEAYRSRWLQRMRGELERQLPVGLDAGSRTRLIDTAVDAACRESIRLTARKRRYPRSRREALAAAEPGEIGREMLDDGSLPLTGCRQVCPQGGCPAREVTAPAAAALRRAAVGDRLRPGNEPDFLLLVNRELLRLYGTDVEILPTVARACTTVQTLDGTQGALGLAAVLRHLGHQVPAERDGEPGGKP